MRWSSVRLAEAFVFLAAALVLSPQAGAQEPKRQAPAPADRARVEAEARGQAAEADRLLKGGEFAAALPLYEAERASRAALGDRRYEAYAARAAGCCHFGLGDDDAAVAAWLAAAKLDALRDDPGFEGYDWFLIGTSHARRGRTADAEAVLLKALPRLSQAVDRDHEADARLLLAHVLLKSERPAEAQRHLNRASDLADALDDPARRASAWRLLGISAAATGGAGLAAERLSDAREAFAGLGRREEVADCDRALGDAFLDLGRLGAAAAALDAAARGHADLGDDAAAASDLELRAAVLADSGDLKSACATALRAAESRRDAADTPGEIEALVSLANYRHQAGDVNIAASVLADAIDLARRSAPPARLARLLVLASGVERNAGRLERAASLADEADAIARRLDNAALRRLVAGAREGLPAPAPGPDRPPPGLRDGLPHKHPGAEFRPPPP